jgi:hypothetical protein
MHGLVFNIRTWRMILFALCAFPAALHAQFSYITNNGAITITGYSGPGGAVVIPSSIDGLPVTRIGNNAFSLRHGITGITIPSTVTAIGDGAFSICDGLTSLSLPDSVLDIGSEAFQACTNLVAVTMSNGLTNIGEKAFSGTCRELTSTAT